MQRRLPTLMLAFALLAACKAGPAAAPAARTDRPSAAPASTTPAASAAPGQVLKLVQPANTSVLAGAVQVDASYIVAQGAGNVIGGNASSVVAQGAGNVIGGNAAAVVATGGDGVVAQGAGNLVVGGHVVAQGAGNVVAQGAGNIVAQGAGNIVAQGAGNIVAQGAGNYRVAQADGLVLSDAKPPYGQTLPTVGAVISARSLVTGRDVALGEDGQGHKVYAIYSNLTGQYQLFLPQDLEGLVAIEARVPKRDDPRSVYTIVSGMGDIDEDTAEVAKYLRRSFANKFRNVMDLLAEHQGSDKDPFLHPEALVTFFRGESSCSVSEGESALEGVVIQPLQELLQAIKANPRIEPADYPVVAQRLGDVVIGNAKNLADYRILPSTYNAMAHELAAENNPFPAQGANAKILATLSEILGDLRANMTALGLKLGDKQAVASYFAKKPYLVYANQAYQKAHPEAPTPRYTIERPSDLADFLVDEYFPLIASNHYGCVTGECPSPPPVADPCGASASPIPSPGFSVAPCSLYDGCLPPEGIAAITNGEIHALSYNVLKDLATSMADLGAKADKPLRPSDVHVIYAASSSFGINLINVVAERRCALLSIIANYPDPGAPCVEPGN